MSWHIVNDKLLENNIPIWSKIEKLDIMVDIQKKLKRCVGKVYINF